MEIKVERLNKKIELPQYQHYGEDAGLDLHAAEELTIKSGEYKLIKTGLKIAVPKGYAAFVYPRSGLALKKGVTVLNAVSYTHLRAHETVLDLVCRLLLEKNNSKIVEHKIKGLLGSQGDAE